MIDERRTKALELFNLTRPYTREQLDRTREQLLHTWNPHRYANLANNPRTYMQLVKQGESMTIEVERAYRLLLADSDGITG
jgi:hypothetical protein